MSSRPMVNEVDELPAGGSPAVAARSIAELPASLLRAVLSARPLAGKEAAAARKAARETAIDWAAVAQVVDASGIGPLALTRLRELGVDVLVTPETAAAWEADRLHGELQCTLQRDDALRLTAAFQERGIRHAFIKGFVVREALYSPTWVRASSDTDLLVDPADVEGARAAMYDLGFVHASRSEDFQNFRPATLAEIRETEAQHYELAQFARVLRLVNTPPWLFGPAYRRQAPAAFEMLPDGPVLNSVVDVHWALHFLFAEDRPLDTPATLPSSDGAVMIPTLTLEWHILFTAFKLYFESFDRPGWGLHLLVDLAALLLRGEGSLDWGWLEAQATRKDLEAMFFHTTCAAERVIGRRLVPDAVLERLRVAGWAPRTSRDSSLDFGDFLPNVLQRRLEAAFLEPVR